MLKVSGELLQKLSQKSEVLPIPVTRNEEGSSLPSHIVEGYSNYWLNSLQPEELDTLFEIENPELDTNFFTMEPITPPKKKVNRKSRHARKSKKARAQQVQNEQETRILRIIENFRSELDQIKSVFPTTELRKQFGEVINSEIAAEKTRILKEIRKLPSGQTKFINLLNQIA